MYLWNLGEKKKTKTHHKKKTPDFWLPWIVGGKRGNWKAGEQKLQTSGCEYL